MIKASDVPREVIQICQTLANSGHRGWIVGGCTRDMLLGKTPSDWDIATDATPECVMSLFEHTIPTGLQHGTVTVRLNETNFEVTTFRSEGTYTDGRRPDEVKFETSIEADLARRDFTMNAIAFDPLNGEIVDPFNGVADLFSRTIRAVGDPMERFNEDGLRPMRAARFASTLNFNIDRQTEFAITQTVDTFKKVAMERIRDELVKVLKSETPFRALHVLSKTGLLDDILKPLQFNDSGKRARLLMTIDNAPRDVCIRTAVILAFVEGDLNVKNDWLEKYRFTNIERDRIVHMLRHYDDDVLVFRMDDISVRRWCHAVGRESIDDILTLTNTLKGMTIGSSLDVNMGVIKRLLPSSVLSIKELAVTGNDLITELGLKPGKQIGVLLNRLLDEALQDPSVNERDVLLKLAREMKNV